MVGLNKPKFKIFVEFIDGDKTKWIEVNEIDLGSWLGQNTGIIIFIAVLIGFLLKRLFKNRQSE